VEAVLGGGDQALDRGVVHGGVAHRAHQRAVAGPVVDDRAQQLAGALDRELLPGGGHEGLRGLRELGQDAGQDGEDEIRQAGEVAVEDGAPVAGRSHDLVDGQLAERSRTEQILGGVEDERPGLVRLLTGAGPGRGGHGRRTLLRAGTS
jgi:hypothetical protein